jgi:Lipopolysaccharide export system permease LptF/LptG
VTGAAAGSRLESEFGDRSNAIASQRHRSAGSLSGHYRSAGLWAREKRLARPKQVPYDRRVMTSPKCCILSQCLGVMTFVTAALSAAVWLAQSLRLIDLVVNHGLSIEVSVYLALILPLTGVFIAVLFTFHRLTVESELVVIRSAGLRHLAFCQARVDPRQDRLPHSNEPVSLHPAGIEPRVQRSAVRDSQPFCRFVFDPTGLSATERVQAPRTTQRPRLVANAA